MYIYVYIYYMDITPITLYTLNILIILYTFNVYIVGSPHLLGE